MSSDSESSGSSQSRSPSPQQSIRKGKRDESSDADPAFTPPEGFTLANELSIPNDFSWEDINTDDDSEIWLIRVPVGVKPKHLDTLTLDGFSRDQSKTTKVGMLPRKHVSYDVMCVGESESHATHGGEELHGLSCLLPSTTRKGKMLLSQKPISRRILIQPQPVAPTAEEPAMPLQSEPRHSYPKEMLRGRFLPVGSSFTANLAPGSVEARVEVDVGPIFTGEMSDPERRNIKKRKVEKGELPKKSKKSKH